MELEDWLEDDDYERMPTGAGDVAVSKYRPPRYKLPVRLFDTPFEHGVLHLSVPDESANDPPGLRSHVNYMLDLVMHPTGGVLNVGTVCMDEGPDRFARWERVSDNLHTTCDLLRAELCVRSAIDEPHEYWANRDLPFGPAIIDFGGGPRPAADDIAVIPGDWRHLPESLADAMDEHAPDDSNARDETHLARNLATALKTLDHPGADYMTHLDALPTDGLSTSQLLDVA